MESAATPSFPPVNLILSPQNGLRGPVWDSSRSSCGHPNTALPLMQQDAAVRLRAILHG